MKILLVEDETGIASFVSQGLTEEGYVVDVAANGLTGLEMARATTYDLLLVDWMLPHKSGVEIIQILRKEGRDIPIIMLTAKDTLQDTVKGLTSGANDYIKKPFHFEELLARVRVQLRKQQASEERFTLGKSIVLDAAAYQVWKDEEEIHLTQREFALLEYLLRHKGRVCRRTRIIENVWDIHFDYDTGIIDVYINAIRKKLNLTADQDYIRTVRGVGYMAMEV